MYFKPAIAVFCKSLDEVVVERLRTSRTGECRWLTGPFIYDQIAVYKHIDIVTLVLGTIEDLDVAEQRQCQRRVFLSLCDRYRSEQQHGRECDESCFHDNRSQLGILQISLVICLCLVVRNAVTVVTSDWALSKGA